MSREEIIDKRELQEQKRITTAMKRLLHELGTNGVDVLVDYYALHVTALTIIPYTIHCKVQYGTPSVTRRENRIISTNNGSLDPRRQ